MAIGRTGRGGPAIRRHAILAETRSIPGRISIAGGQCNAQGLRRTMSNLRFSVFHRSVLPALAALLVGCDTMSGNLPGGNDPAQNGGLVSSETPPPGSTPSVAASLLEQLTLERINRARLRPGPEAARYGIAIDEGIPGQLSTTPKPAVALNAALSTAARLHAQDMLANDYFGHNNLSGKTPFDRINAAGYAFTTAGENLAWRGTTGNLDTVDGTEQQHEDLFVDTGIDGRGHRVTMLNRNFREIGLAVVRGNFTREGITYDSLMQAQEYATSLDDAVFVLGVVYNDANKNAQYDHSEGIANSSVRLDDVVKATNIAGGYSFAVSAPGTYTLRFASNASVTVRIDFGSNNIKVDHVGADTIIVNHGLGPLN